MLRSPAQPDPHRPRGRPHDPGDLLCGQVLIVEQHHRLPLVSWQGLHRLPKGIVPRLPARYCRFRGQIIQRDCPASPLAETPGLIGGDLQQPPGQLLLFPQLRIPLIGPADCLCHRLLGIAAVPGDTESQTVQAGPAVMQHLAEPLPLLLRQRHVLPPPSPVLPV